MKWSVSVYITSRVPLFFYLLHCDLRAHVRCKLFIACVYNSFTVTLHDHHVYKTFTFTLHGHQLSSAMNQCPDHCYKTNH